MTKPGHIEITDKVRFVFHELPKPKIICWCDSCFSYNHKELRKYEASKRTVEVSNVIKENDANYGFLQWDEEGIVAKPIDLLIIDGQKCKAEVNGTAKIIELTKYICKKQINTKRIT